MNRRYVLSFAAAAAFAAWSAPNLAQENARAYTEGPVLQVSYIRTEPGKFDEPHSIAIDSRGLLYVGDRRNKRVQVFDQSGKFLRQWNHLGTPWGVFVKDDRLYVVDGTEANNLYIVSTKDGKVLDKVDGLRNATAHKVDEQVPVSDLATLTATYRRLIATCLG